MPDPTVSDAFVDLDRELVALRDRAHSRYRSTPDAGSKHLVDAIDAQIMLARRAHANIVALDTALTGIADRVTDLESRIDAMLHAGAE